MVLRSDVGLMTDRIGQRGVLIFFGTTLVNCIYLTVEKSNAESKSGLIDTLLALVHAVHDIEW